MKMGILVLDRPRVNLSQSPVLFACACVRHTRCKTQDKLLLETVAKSVATGAVLDQKQRWAAVMQVEPLRRVVAESLHQVSQSCPRSLSGAVS